MPKSSVKTFVFATLVAVAVSIVLGQRLGAVQKDASTSTKGFKAVKIAPDLATSDNVISLVLPYIGNHPEAIEGRPKLDLSIARQGESLVFDLELGGYLDDSVAGEHFRGVIISSTKGWELTYLGVKYICYRGMSKNGKCT